MPVADLSGCRRETVSVLRFHKGALRRRPRGRIHYPAERTRRPQWARWRHTGGRVFRSSVPRISGPMVAAMLPLTSSRSRSTASSCVAHRSMARLAVPEIVRVMRPSSRSEDPTDAIVSEQIVIGRRTCLQFDGDPVTTCVAGRADDVRSTQADRECSLNRSTECSCN